tara:strand:+ start:4573 stop:4812 length:240 start_codon:yes stop_codon:yes gene_type:complete
MSKITSEQIDLLERSLRANFFGILAEKLSTATCGYVDPADIKAHTVSEDHITVICASGRIIIINKDTEKLISDSEAKVH